jgi:hypothetical protein
MCQDQQDFNNEIKIVRHDLMLNVYPKEFVDSDMKPSTRYHPFSETITRVLTSLMLRLFPRNSDVLGTVSISRPFSEQNTHSVGH